ncbi:MAG TPA: methylmalonyl Co-A mutase-associated GTPase MeaB [Gemmatimonadaceae bacterium]|nr:methylmalonyl Co-A mutase-associated GTPase MeaB [Gemmatimonadaceae bacterium]
MPAATDRLLTDLEAGRKSALARAVSVVENQRDGVDEILAAMHPKLGRARRIGITGPPGAGKSTITTLVTRAFRDRDLTVGIICVDPTSPFTGGALLGDRVRMESVALDEGVFIRSMATRGSLGGLAASTREIADVLDGFGFDRVIIETVGVGQSELDVARTADTTMVVLVPESGDSIQTLKAGVMEVADVFVINKSDRPGADRLRNDVELMLGLRKGNSYSNMPAHHGVDMSRLMNPARAAREAASTAEADHWTPPVLRTVAVKQEGIDTVVESLDRHFNYLERTGALRQRRRERLTERVLEVAERKIRRRLMEDETAMEWVRNRVDDLEAGVVTPYVVADDLLAAYGNLVKGATK